ncbi:unnamed protein product, partial [Brassica oleracea var. botrytis]
GVEAQTLANVYLALENNLKIVHVSTSSRFILLALIFQALSQSPKQVLREIEETVAKQYSARQRIPPPPETAEKPFRALIFDRYILCFWVWELYELLNGQTVGRPVDSPIKTSFGYCKRHFATATCEALLARQGGLYCNHASTTSYLSLNLVRKSSGVRRSMSCFKCFSS